MKKTIKCLALICLPLPFTGCGMLAVPSRVTLPSEHLGTVLVSDQDTGAAIPSARVTFEMWKHVNWMKPMPFETWGPYSSTNSSGWQPELADSWSATALGDGLFQFDSKRKTGWTQVWFPLGLPLGGVLYRTYDGRVVVQAPGYEGIWISHATVQGVAKAQHAPENQEAPFQFSEEQVHVRIKRDRTAHNNSVGN